MFSLCHILEKGSGEKVVADVSSVVDQLSSRTLEFSRLWWELAVLHHLGDTSHPADHTHGL